MIYGGGGDDKISGGPNGNDTICGGPGRRHHPRRPRQRHAPRRGGDDRYSASRVATISSATTATTSCSAPRAPTPSSAAAATTSCSGGARPRHAARRRGRRHALRRQSSERVSTARRRRPHLRRARQRTLTAAAATTSSMAVSATTRSRRGGSDLLSATRSRRHLRRSRATKTSLRGDIGFDKLDGGPGERDIASFSTASEAVTVDLAAGSAHGDGRDTICHRHRGHHRSAYNDTLIGDGGAEPARRRCRLRRALGRRRHDELFGGPDGADCSGGSRGRLRTGLPPSAAERGPRPQHRRQRLPHRAGYRPATTRCSISKQGSSYVVTDAGFSFSRRQRPRLRSVSGNAVCAADVQTSCSTPTPATTRSSVDGSVPPEIEVRIEGGPGPTSCRADGGDVIEAGDDNDPDVLEGGPGDDALIGARTDLPVPFNSGKSTLIGGPGSDVMVGGDPCDGDIFDGGPGDDDANFFRFTPGVNAEIGGPVSRGGEPLHPRPHRLLGRAARGLTRSRHADRRPPRRPDRPRRPQQAAPAPVAVPASRPFRAGAG